MRETYLSQSVDSNCNIMLLLYQTQLQEGQEDALLLAASKEYRNSTERRGGCILLVALHYKE